MRSILDTTFTTAQLELSPMNVRPHTPDASDLEPSILAVGLKEPILVHPMRGRRGVYGVFAGGRRIKAIRALVKRGALPADWPVPVRLHEGFSDIELEEMSLVENVGRQDMKPHEIYAAVRKIVARGGTVDQLASLLGRDPAEARRWLRLGQLARPIFDALAAGEVTDEEARAYGATEDATLQRAVFERLRELPRWQRSAAAIRAALGFDDAENRRWLAYVGDEAYRVAGGGFELDLFADDAMQRGRVADPALLRRLADAKLDALRAELRHAAGRPGLRFVAEPPQHPHYAGPDGALRIASAAAPVATAAVLPDGDVVGYIVVQQTGDVDVQWYWASRKAKHGATKPSQPVRDSIVTAVVSAPATPVATPAHDAAVAAMRPTEGYSTETVGIFASLRRRVLQAALIEDAGKTDDAIAADLLVWSQLRQLLGTESSREVGLRGLTMLDHDKDAARPLLTDTAASRMLSGAIAELQAQPFLDEADMARAFESFYEAEDRLKKMAAAVVAGQALERSLDSGALHSPLHDLIASVIGVDCDAGFRRWWEPTTTFLELVPVRERLAIAEPLVEPATYAVLHRLKSSELTQRVLELVTAAAAGVRRSMAGAAATWVHPLMRFRPPGPPDTAAAEPVVREAAE